MRALHMSALAFSLAVVFWAGLARADAPPKVTAVRENDTWTVDAKGDAVYSAKIVYPNEKTFLEVKESFPDPKILLRDYIGPSSKFAMLNVRVAFNDQDNALETEGIALGAAQTDKRCRWQLYVGNHFELLFADETDHKYVLSGQVETDNTLTVITSIVELPAGARNVLMNGETGMFEYDLDRAPKKGSADLDVDLKAKARVMSAVYKIFANPDYAEGTYWLGKCVFHNAGDGDITHLKISYSIEGYADWSPPREYGLLAAGGHVVDCYYPVLSKDLATLNSATPVDLVMKYSYIDSDGQSHEDTASARLTFLSCHAIEYSNTPEEDRTGAWTDDFSNSPLIAAFVNRNDDPVRKFEGMVAQACGGVPGGATDESTKKFCKTLYDMMVENGVSYVLSTEYFVNYTAGQEIKYPRDVLRDKAGTCIELAIFYAAVCESAGIECHLVMIPGHCFPVAVLPSGDLLPVEATAISGAALPDEISKGRKTLPFYGDDDNLGAVEVGIYEYTHERKPGHYYEVDIDEEQIKGVVCPELPPVDDQFLSGYKVYAETDDNGGNNAQPGNNNPQPQPTAAINLTGHFTGELVNTSANVRAQLALDIKQDGTNLTAQCGVGDGQINLSGALNGNAFTLTGQIGGNNEQIKLEGQTDGQTLKGKFTNSLGGGGEFTLQRAGQ